LSPSSQQRAAACDSKIASTRACHSTAARSVRSTLVFASNRAGGAGGYDLYVAEWTCD
jgi:hypothetical protein